MRFPFNNSLVTNSEIEGFKIVPVVVLFSHAISRLGNLRCEVHYVGFVYKFSKGMMNQVQVKPVPKHDLDWECEHQGGGFMVFRQAYGIVCAITSCGNNSIVCAKFKLNLPPKSMVLYRCYFDAYRMVFLWKSKIKFCYLFFCREIELGFLCTPTIYKVLTNFFHLPIFYSLFCFVFGTSFSILVKFFR